MNENQLKLSVKLSRQISIIFSNFLVEIDTDINRRK